MAITLKAVTVDCQNAAALAEFWATVTGRDVAAGASPFFALLPAKNPGEPAMMFIAVPDKTVGKNAIHWDLAPGEETPQGLAAEKDRLTTIGATVVAERREYGHQWVTFSDPEDNQFCVGIPDPDASPADAAPAAPPTS